MQISVALLLVFCITFITGSVVLAVAAAMNMLYIGIGLCLLVGIIGCVVFLKLSSPIEKIQNYVLSLTTEKPDLNFNPKSCGLLENLGSNLENLYKSELSKILWYESILNSIPLAIAVTDMDMKWTFCNTASLKSMNKKSNAEILGVHCSAKKGNICNTPNCGIEQLRKGNKKVINKMPNGNVTEITLDYIYDKNGKAIGHVEIGQDITEQHRLKLAEEADKKRRIETEEKLQIVISGLGDSVKDLYRIIDKSTAGANNQADRLTETATAMNEMTATVGEVASNASDAAQLSINTRHKAEEGAKIVADAVSSITQVGEQSTKLKTVMEELLEHSKSIDAIMRVISDIADQTNLLALNAAIEAARAGEAGRGFAVVADEVRKLAEKTMASTADVGKAIRGIQASANMSAEQVDATVQLTEKATEYANQSGVALQEIVQLVDTTADQV
ncbi:MAG: PAS domain-containing methyl-accepting chemotaxis protein, partial [Desulfovibrionaceae bacterium]|nr:PAS domain-containing methyl-accepting chemotaxis protein [Desulfovibrionaceae bacterium]